MWERGRGGIPYYTVIESFVGSKVRVCGLDLPQNNPNIYSTLCLQISEWKVKTQAYSVQLHAAIPHMVLQRLQWKRNYLAQHVFSKWMRMPFVSLAIALSFALCLPPSPSLFVHPPLFAYNSPGCRSFSLFLYRTRSFFSLVFVTDINNVTHLLAQNRCACPNLFPLNRVRFCFSFSSPNRFLDASIPYRCFHCFLLIWFADICLAKIAFSIREKTTKLFKKKNKQNIYWIKSVEMASERERDVE